MALEPSLLNNIVPPQRKLVLSQPPRSFGTLKALVAHLKRLSNHDMGGPNLEVFKFAMYVSLPLLVMMHYGNPEWYAKNVLPVCNVLPHIELSLTAL